MCFASESRTLNIRSHHKDLWNETLTVFNFDNGKTSRGKIGGYVYKVID